MYSPLPLPRTHSLFCHHIQASATSLYTPTGLEGFPVEPEGRYTPETKDITHHPTSRLNSCTDA